MADYISKYTGLQMDARWDQSHLHNNKGILDGITEVGYTNKQIDDKLSAIVSEELTEEQVEAIVDTVLKNAEGVEVVTPSQMQDAISTAGSNYVDLINNQTISGDKTFNSIYTANVPDTSTALVNKGYIDTNVFNPLSTQISAQEDALTEATNTFSSAITSQNTAIAAAISNIDTHIKEDNDVRWPSINKAISDLRVELKQFVIDTYAGTTPQYDYSQTQTILIAGGLVSLADQGTYTVPVNGAIQAQVGGLLGAGLVILVNGTAVWTAPINLLVPLNSPEIQVNAGDQISYTGTVGLGQTIQVDYFPNKGT